MRFVSLLCAGLFLATVSGICWAADEVDTLLADANRYWADKQFEDAERSFKQAVALAPDRVDLHRRLAGLYLSRNKSGEAIEEYQTAITLSPEDPTLFLALAIAYLHQGRYTAASAMTSEAQRLDPSLAQADKVRRYIDAKREALKQAAAADVSEAHGLAPIGAAEETAAP